MNNQQEIIYIDDTDEDDRVRREAERDRIRYEAVLTTRKKIFSLEPPSEDESSNESSSSHRVLRVTQLMRRQPKPWPRGIVPATKPTKPTKAAWKRLAQSPVDTRLDREIRTPIGRTPTGRPTSAHGIASTVSPAATRKSRVSDSFGVKRPTELAAGVSSQVSLPNTATGRPRASDHPNSVARMKTTPTTATKKPSAIDSVSVKRPTVSTGHVSSRADLTSGLNGKPRASGKPRSATSPAPARSEAKRTSKSPAPLPQSNEAKRMSSSTTNTVSYRSTDAGSAKRTSTSPAPLRQSNQTKRMTSSATNTVSSRNADAGSAQVDLSAPSSPRQIHIRPFFDANKTWVPLTDGRIGWLIQKPDRKLAQLKLTQKMAERMFNEAFNAKPPVYAAAGDYPSDDDFERPSKRTKFIDRSHSFIRPGDYECTDDDYGTETICTSDEGASAGAGSGNRGKSQFTCEHAASDSDDGTEEKWPIPCSTRLAKGDELLDGAPGNDEAKEKQTTPRRNAYEATEEKDLVPLRQPTDKEWQDLLALEEVTAADHCVEPQQSSASESRPAFAGQLVRETAREPVREPAQATEQAAEQATEQAPEEAPEDAPEEAPEEAPEQEPAPEPVHEPPVFPWASWPSHVVHVRANFNPTELTFPNYSSFGLCGCTSPCRLDSCMNGRLHVFCDNDCCMFDGRCGNSLRGVKCLQLVECRRGNGLSIITTEAIDRGVVLGEYMGELAVGVAAPNSGYRLELTERAEEAPNQRVSIDASRYGTILRFMNHSCDANCRFVEVSNGRRHAAVVVTTKKIRAGEEVTVYYGHDLWFVCKCGSDKCLHRDLHEANAE